MSTTNNENSTHTYETLQNQAPTAVPNWNTQVPPFVQNVPSPTPAYNAAPSSQMWTIPTMAPQWSVARVAEPNSDPLSPFYQTFLKGKPRALGIVMILSAILEIALGIGLCFTIFSITLPSGIAFWGPIFYIIAGSLTIAARAKPNPCLNSGYTVLSILLIANVLLFCVSLSLSIFGCRSLSKVTSNGPQVFLIQNDAVISMNRSTVPATFGGVSQPFPTENTPPPPPYVFQEFKARQMS